MAENNDSLSLPFWVVLELLPHGLLLSSAGGQPHSRPCSCSSRLRPSYPLLGSRVSPSRWQMWKLCSPCGHSMPILKHVTDQITGQVQIQGREIDFVSWQKEGKVTWPRGIGTAGVFLTIYHRLKWTFCSMKSSNPRRSFPLTPPPFPGGPWSSGSKSS